MSIVVREFQYEPFPHVDTGKIGEPFKEFSKNLRGKFEKEAPDCSRCSRQNTAGWVVAFNACFHFLGFAGGLQPTFYPSSRYPSGRGCR